MQKWPQFRLLQGTIHTGFKLKATLVFAGVIAMSGTLAAQDISLKIRPRIGDTIMMQMEQSYKMYYDSESGESGVNAGTPGTAGKGGASANRDGAGGSGDGPQRVPSAKAVPIYSAFLSVRTRSVVISRESDETLIESTTEWVDIKPKEAELLPMFAKAKRSVKGKKVALKIRSDGGARVVSEGGDEKSSGLVWAHTPSLLPPDDVTVLDKWSREMQFPAAATHAGGVVKAVFVFDSISRDARYAYITVTGIIENSAKGAASDSISGTLSGAIQVDRKLGWVCDSQMEMTVATMVRLGRTNPLQKVTVNMTQKLSSAAR